MNFAPLGGEIVGRGRNSWDTGTHKQAINSGMPSSRIIAALQMAYTFATNVTRLVISLATAEQEARNIISHKGPNFIIRISVLTCNISPCEYPTTIHTFALPSNIKCISTTPRSVTMIPHSFLNNSVPLPIHFNQSRETSTSFLILGRLGSQLLLNLQRYKMSGVV